MAEVQEPEVEPQLTIDDILVVTVEELRIECLRRELDAIGLTKPAIQRLLLSDIGATTTSTPAGQDKKATQPEPLSPRHAPLPDDDTRSTKAMSERPSPPPADQTSGSGEIRFKFPQLGAGLNQHWFGSQQWQSVQGLGHSDYLSGPSDIQLQLRRMN